MKNMETKYVNEAKKDSRRFYDDLFYQYKGSWPVYALTINPCFILMEDIILLKHPLTVI